MSDNLREALEAIHELCDEEIKARWGGSSTMSIERASRGSKLYPLLVLPRNIAAAALATPASSPTVTEEMVERGARALAEDDLRCNELGMEPASDEWFESNAYACLMTALAPEEGGATA